MSQFYSDMINWSFAGLLTGAVALGGVDLSAPAPQVSRGDAGEDLRLASVGLDAGVLAASLEVPAEPLPTIIAQAELEEVNFTATGIDSGDLTAATPAAKNMGTVTGNRVNIRSGPGTGFAIVTSAVRDDKLQITGSRDGSWVEVRAPITGDPVWIHGKFFAVSDFNALAQN
ncbi:MAG: SH3 domain-containing protein [Pseudomonadota bacterium]